MLTVYRTVADVSGTRASATLTGLAAGAASPCTSLQPASAIETASASAPPLIARTDSPVEWIDLIGWCPLQGRARNPRARSRTRREPAYTDGPRPHTNTLSLRRPPQIAPRLGNQV